jgi:hypothetical protein
VIIREFHPEDEGTLRELHERGGYGFRFPENIKDYSVVVDAFGRPFMAAGLKPVSEVTLICAPGPHPLVTFRGISLLHEGLRDKLSAGNHNEALTFLSPRIEKAFGRHLVRHFGWNETWKCFAIRIGD